ncbi:acyl-CoA synthetase family member 2, mitochondrial isoform X1 [Tupaia chinensis]|uniref:acyl-CoA synthetase family member 2, mitochondrial isoform X1 n=2 Tax=Tupaia chinensis TaxID=246437 RepID=UPI0003C8FBAD|nr:acyl-CoA synthetase family member 2, mitochondrial isoform X1 [Tupaia chinensis]XP_014438719.1 acyl-CoA synthetase family member 2, mitochondrial isoform X1 [Tupaia chinensis]
MVVYIGMLRLGRLCAGSPGVLGARAVLSRSWQEASLQGVRLLSSKEENRSAPLPIGGLSYIQGRTRMRLISKTVGRCLDATAQRVPDKDALIVLQENVRLTFAQLKEEVDKAAAGLLSIGLCRGDRLGMWGPNSYAWVLMQLATAQAGIILVSVNPAYQAMELEYVLRKVGCKALVFPKQFRTQQYYNILKQICPELEQAQPGALKSQRLPDLTTVISVDDPLPGTLLLDEVVAAGSTEQQLAQLRYTQQFLSCHDPINIQFTSGTTGSPKGATLSHYNIVNNSNMIGERLRLGKKKPEESRVILPSPLYHCLGSVGGTMVCVMHGATLILSSPIFDGKKALEAVSKERGSFLYGTPTMFVDILNQPDFSSYDISTMCGGVIAGSPAPPELIRAIINKLNMRDLVVAYGTTENSPVTFMSFPEDTVEQKAESVGRIMPHTEAKIVNVEDGKLLELNTPGELCIRGYCVMLGYWGEPEKTQEAVGQDKWYWTGDIATMDEQGFCKIVGRSKDMIIRGGENIYPAELEDFFHTHPQVQEVQVVGVKDDRMGEEICACIRLKSGEETTAEEIKAFCKGKISHFKIPRYVVFVTNYPLTISGKVQKFKLREQMERHLNL